jgi:hypothetical protein
MNYQWMLGQLANIEWNMSQSGSALLISRNAFVDQLPEDVGTAGKYQMEHVLIRIRISNFS